MFAFRRTFDRGDTERETCLREMNGISAAYPANVTEAVDEIQMRRVSRTQEKQFVAMERHSFLTANFLLDQHITIMTYKRSTS